MHKRLTISRADLLFLASNGRPIRVRDMLRSATKKVVRKEYTPGAIRIILRNILDHALTTSQQSTTHNNRVVAISFGHQEDTDARWYKARTEYEQGCLIYERLVLQSKSVDAVDIDDVVTTANMAFEYDHSEPPDSAEDDEDEAAEHHEDHEDHEDDESDESDESDEDDLNLRKESMFRSSS